MLKKDEKILARLERENKKATACAGARPFMIEGGDYEICFNNHEAMCWNDGPADIAVSDEAAPRCFTGYFNDFANNFSDRFKYLEIIIDRGEVEAARKADNRTGYCKNPWVYDVSENLKLGVNPRYMKDHLDFCKTDRCYVLANGFNKFGVYVNPVFFMSENGERVSMVLPINLKVMSENRKENEAA